MAIGVTVPLVACGSVSVAALVFSTDTPGAGASPEPEKLRVITPIGAPDKRPKDIWYSLDSFPVVLVSSTMLTVATLAAESKLASMARLNSPTRLVGEKLDSRTMVRLLLGFGMKFIYMHTQARRNGHSPPARARSRDRRTSARVHGRRLTWLLSQVSTIETPSVSPSPP